MVRDVAGGKLALVAPPLDPIELLDRPTVTPTRSGLPSRGLTRYPMSEPVTTRELAVEAVKLERTFGTFVAVDKIDLAVRKGEIYGFLGPNGAGKSTTCRMLCTLTSPSGGRATVAGFDVAKESDSVRLRIGA